MREIDALRVRLGRADHDGREAWSEAAALLRQIVNADAQGVAVRASIEALQPRFEAVVACLHELRAVEESLVRLSSTSPREPPFRVRATAPAEPPPACATCGRSDAVVRIPICMRCSQTGSFELD